MNKKILYKLLRQDNLSNSFRKDTTLNFSILKKISEKYSVENFDINSYRLDCRKDILFKEDGINLSDNTLPLNKFLEPSDPSQTEKGLIFLNRTIVFIPNEYGNINGNDVYYDKEKDKNFNEIKFNNSEKSGTFNKNGIKRINVLEDSTTGTYFSKIKNSQLTETDILKDTDTNFFQNYSFTTDLYIDDDNYKINILNLETSVLNVVDNKLNIKYNSTNYTFGLSDNKLSDNKFALTQNSDSEQIVYEDNEYNIYIKKDIDERKNHKNYFLFGLTGNEIEFIETNNEILGVTFSKMDNGKISITCNKLIEGATNVS